MDDATLLADGEYAIEPQPLGAGRVVAISPPPSPESSNKTARCTGVRLLYGACRHEAPSLPPLTPLLSATAHGEPVRRRILELARLRTRARPIVFTDRTKSPAGTSSARHGPKRVRLWDRIEYSRGAENHLALHYLNEGNFVDEAGNLISVWYLDMGDPDKRVPIRTLVKAGRKEHAMGKLGTIRVSKPAHFRKDGEGLILDPTETLVSRSVVKSKRIDPSELEAERAAAREFEDETRRCAAAIKARAWTSFTHKASQERTVERTVHLTLGKNGWIYSTSVEPDDQEDIRRWRGSMSEEYDHFQPIHRRREFARALALMVAQQLGPRGKEVTLNSKFEEERFESTHRNQLIIHGPVVYTANAFDLTARAASGGERTFLPVFAKDIRYADQREYRFAIWTNEEPDEEYVDLRVSKAMRGALEPLRGAAAEAEDGRRDRADAPPSARRAPVTRTQIREAPADTGVPSSLFRDGSIHFPHQSNPTATPFIPNTHASGEFDAAVQEAAAAEAALGALRHKVGQVSGRRRTKIAAAAWHAEPWIRSLCSRYHDPIGGVRISDDDILVIHLKLPPELEATARIGFGPSGASVYGVDRGGRYTTGSSSPQWTHMIAPEMFMKTLDELGLRRRAPQGISKPMARLPVDRFDPARGAVPRKGLPRNRSAGIPLTSSSHRMPV